MISHTPYLNSWNLHYRFSLLSSCRGESVSSFGGCLAAGQHQPMTSTHMDPPHAPKNVWIVPLVSKLASRGQQPCVKDRRYHVLCHYNVQFSCMLTSAFLLVPGLGFQSPAGREMCYGPLRLRSCSTRNVSHGNEEPLYWTKITLKRNYCSTCRNIYYGCSICKKDKSNSSFIKDTAKD